MKHWGILCCLLVISCTSNANKSSDSNGIVSIIDYCYETPNNLVSYVNGVEVFWETLASQVEAYKAKAFKDEAEELSLLFSISTNLYQWDNVGLLYESFIKQEQLSRIDSIVAVYLAKVKEDEVLTVEELANYYDAIYKERMANATLQPSKYGPAETQEEFVENIRRLNIDILTFEEDQLDHRNDYHVINRDMDRFYSSCDFDTQAKISRYMREAEEKRTAKKYAEAGYKPFASTSKFLAELEKMYEDVFKKSKSYDNSYFNADNLYVGFMNSEISRFTNELKGNERKQFDELIRKIRKEDERLWFTGVGYELHSSAEKFLDVLEIFVQDMSKASDDRLANQDNFRLNNLLKKEGSYWESMMTESQRERFDDLDDMADDLRWPQERFPFLEHMVDDALSPAVPPNGQVD